MLRCILERLEGNSCKVGKRSTQKSITVEGRKKAEAFDIIVVANGTARSLRSSRAGPFGSDQTDLQLPHWA
ncbi:hypothetical protein CKA34_22550 (plasmid) [Rhizobium sp. 11515TR]|nr:hypothetical protein CKA34_22550 [Rhizobium sp. 11515TR]